MIITDFNKWNGYRFGNKLLGVNNIIQISSYYNQDYNFNNFDGLEIFDIKTQTKSYNNESFDILDLNYLVENRASIKLDNDKFYYLEPCLFELFHEFNSVSTFDIFKFNDLVVKERTVGVHYRGTDFNLWDKKAIFDYDFYKNSVDFILTETKDNYTFILFTDDYSLKSFNKTIEYLDSLGLKYELGDINNFKSDFKKMSSCDYIISTPSTFCITASICGVGGKKIIHNKNFINYKYTSNYFRDIFWKRIVDEDYKNNDYTIYKLI